MNHEYGPQLLERIDGDILQGDQYSEHYSSASLFIYPGFQKNDLFDSK
jgi:hypothetical protein